MKVSFEKTSFVWKPRRVWYEGTDALVKGEGVCYNADYFSAVIDGHAATDPYEGRLHLVERPTTTNNLRFAGVVVRDYAANALGHEVEIHEPGGLAQILVGVDTVLNETLLTCSASATDAGRFTQQGFMGRGTALALETDAAGQLYSLMTGVGTAAHAAGVTTITAAAIGTACGHGVAFIPGCRLVVLGGADDATGGDAGAGHMATVGVYTILSAPTAATVTIAEDIEDVDVTVYVLPAAEHTVLAYLYDGEESGLQEFISPQDAIVVDAMIGGVSFICGGYTMGAASTHALANATVEGLRKGFLCLGAIGTGYVVSPASGLQGDIATALATLTYDAADEVTALEWHGAFSLGAAGTWNIIQQAGVGIG